EENRGQAPTGVNFLSRTPSGVVLLGAAGVALESDGGRTISMCCVGARAPGVPAGEQKLPGTTSYLVGDESDWVRAVPNYESVRYPSVYQGIDVVFHGNQMHLEYDFVLSPGAKPGEIRIAFEG